MNDEQLKQRLKYLIEHGGVWDDPLADIRRGVRWAWARWRWWCRWSNWRTNTGA